MKVSIAHDNQVVVVGLSGSLDVSVQKELKDKLIDASQSKETDLVVDFSGVEFIDSSCLGVLVSLAKKLREQKGDIKISRLSSDVKSIFQITRLDRVFEIFDDNKQAVDSYYK